MSSLRTSYAVNQVSLLKWDDELRDMIDVIDVYLRKELFLGWDECATGFIRGAPLFPRR